MAHKKGQGSSRNGRDSNPQYRGVKRHDGMIVNSGTILVRQVGSKFHAGRFVGIGKDWTLYAKSDGIVRFEQRKNRRYVTIIPIISATEDAGADLGADQAAEAAEAK